MKIWRQICAAATVGVLGLASTLTHAALEIPAAVNVSAGPTVIVTPGPGVKAATTLTFEFLSDYAFNSITLHLDYNPDVLQFSRSDSSISVFAPLAINPSATISLPNAAALLTPIGNTETNDLAMGRYSVSGSTDTDYPFAAGTKLVLHGVFDLKPSFDSTTTTFVTMSGGIAGTSADPFEEDTFSGLQATVTAVPEPETWMMLIGGLALIASRLRRVSRARSASVA